MIYDLTQIESLYWTKTPEPVFKESMAKVCSHILEFLDRAACHLKKHPITQTLKDMFNQSEWDDLLLAIEDAEARVIKTLRSQWLEGCSKDLRRSIGTTDRETDRDSSQRNRSPQREDHGIPQGTS